MSDQLIEKMNSNKIEAYTQREYNYIMEKIGIKILESVGNIIEFSFTLSDGEHIGITSINDF